MNAADPAPPCVLIAEGDPWVRDMLREMLLSVRCDARLQVCADGSEALTALASKPDLIIAARELTGLDGLDLLRKVRAKGPGLPFILISTHSDSASVREALPLRPTAYLSKPLNMEKLRKSLEELLLAVGEQVACPVPPLKPGASLPAYLEQRRATADGGPLFADVQLAIKRALNPQGLNLKVLEEEVRNDPQVTAVLIAAANSASLHRDAPVQTLLQALNKLGSTQSMNLMLGLTLKRSARLSDPLLAQPAAHFWNLSLHTAEHGRTLARMLELDAERCYCAGLLHCLGDLAVLRSLQEWRLAGGELDESLVQSSLKEFGAAFGSALRTRWRLPLNLRELIAAIYQLGGGVYSREILAMNLAGQLARLPADQGLEKVANSKTARLLKVGLPELSRLRKVENTEVKPQEEAKVERPMAIEPSISIGDDSPAGSGPEVVAPDMTKPSLGWVLQVPQGDKTLSASMGYVDTVRSRRRGGLRSVHSIITIIAFQYLAHLRLKLDCHFSSWSLDYSSMMSCNFKHIPLLERLGLNPDRSHTELLDSCRTLKFPTSRIVVRAVVKRFIRLVNTQIDRYPRTI